ncbi:similar to Saccharomyces cerevisiae YNL048W ALG11 Alpha-1,2-mannosyltransferase [Maudiozyma saulgeensis]|uniref:GDP-Man:Man(3)GlcNAc(2)-PP-Dol alpha-1,2-mannosyltransferase n=1 Tax=Maudiozyma saulgeensis TaxID=1789683 RepID=A0A1X7R9B3_9SACH|nr:similar to Saccharomyces cerevisiae YNL048W ALG11 Alpha-1,2-mannosyltransferase [Kazachstania saulgeensis]
MVDLLSIAIAQCMVTFCIVYLRMQSVNRSLMKAPRNYKDKLLKGISKGGKLAGVFHSWKIGSVRRELLLRAKDVRNFTNEGDAGLLDIMMKDSDEKENIIESLKNDEKTEKTLFGFFHPYCNAGGGGEKVLWKAVETTLKFDPNIIVVIYTGDCDATGEQILESVSKRFDYELDASRISFIFLKYRKYVDSKTWPHFTLLGQAIGSVLLSIEAILKCPPDIWCDSMGFPFGYPWVWHLLRIPIITYTHFPVISSDMLNKLSHQQQTLKNRGKGIYWKLFMKYYEHMGSFITIACTNSSWTNDHISRIWTQCKTNVIFPPCSTEKLVHYEKEGDLPAKRLNQAVVLAQFRPEKRHKLIIEEYAKYLETAQYDDVPKLIFIGSTRSDEDRKYIEELKTLALDELKIPKERFEIIPDLPYEDIKKMLWSSTYGINAMWNEHFGIAVVEYIAGGLIPIVHGSAGPLFDIVIDNVGFFFLDPSDPDYKETSSILGFGTLCDALKEVSYLDDKDKKKLSDIAIRIALTKFSDSRFEEKWIDQVLSKVSN